MKRITIIGSEGQRGTYLLRMHVKRDVQVRFGRFQGGREIFVPAGDVVYVGSAMAQRGSMTLARRLLRHATRNDAHHPHRIRDEMVTTFLEAGLGPAELEPPVKKKLFWNIDYLLDEADVELSRVLILRSGMRLEDDLALFLEGEPGCSALAKGLGAHDRKGETHIFVVRETADWWEELPGRLERMVARRGVNN